MIIKINMNSKRFFNYKEKLHNTYGPARFDIRTQCKTYIRNGMFEGECTKNHRFGIKNFFINRERN